MFRTRPWLWYTQSACPSSSHAAAKSPQITVQPAIKRSPTDLLEALSATVGVDPTAPHFQFIDDPTTIPSTVANRRTYYMAKELGKRAARQLATEWPTLFAFDRDLPRLPAFRPQKQADPTTMELTENNLRLFMEKRAVKDACVFYERLRAEDKDISDATKVELFKLSAYYNGQDPPLTEVEEWHGLRNLVIEKPRAWTSAGVADLVYESLPPSVETDCILISALCKHATSKSVKRAKGVFEELLKKGATPTSDAFAALIAHSEWSHSLELLQKMNKLGVKPTMEVWQAAVESAAKIKQEAKQIAALQKVLGEARSLGYCDLPLRTYNTVLSALLPPMNEDSKGPDEDKKLATALSVLQEMLTDLESRDKIELYSSSDGDFFVSAMSLSSRAGCLPLARRVRSLYESPHNLIRLSALLNEGIFYTSFVMTATARETAADAFRRLYIEHVPRVVGVSRGLALAVADRLKACPDWQLLLRLTEDCISARLSVDGRVMQTLRSLLLNTAFGSLSVVEREELSSLVSRLVSISLELSSFTDPKFSRLQYKMSPTAVSELALLLNRVGETERAWELLELLQSEAATSGENSPIGKLGHPRLSALSELFDDALRRADEVGAACCLEIMATQLSRQKCEQYAQKIIDRCHLNEAQTRILKGFARLRPQ